MASEKYYSLEEVAELLGVTYQLIYRLVRSGELSSVRVGKVYRVTDEDLHTYLENSRVSKSDGMPAPMVCSVCGRSYVSALSIVGSCKVCGAPICKSCAEVKHATHCEVHSQVESEK